jgi:threonine dehydrogenase-like Zn-dependent dehydrogenase
LAEVVEVGPEVDDLRPGDLVVTMVGRPCAHAGCRPCRRGRQGLLRATGDYAERGIKGRYRFALDVELVNFADLLDVDLHLPAAPR